MASDEVEVPVPPHTTNLAELANSTLLVFKLLRPWCKSDYSSLALQPIKYQAKSYMQALELSVQAAQHGFNIAEDALAFADLLGPEYNEDDRQDYLRGMLRIARLGEGNAQEAHVKFRGVRVKLLQLIKDARTQQRQESSDQAAGMAPKLNELENGISTLEKFSACVSLYISWWNAISMSHIAQSKRLEQVVFRYNSLRARDVVQKWRDLRLEYVNYTDKVRQIQDADPGFAVAVERIVIPAEQTSPQQGVPQEPSSSSASASLSNKTLKADAAPAVMRPAGNKWARKKEAFNKRFFGRN